MDRTETQSWMDTVEALHNKILGLEASLAHESQCAEKHCNEVIELKKELAKAREEIERLKRGHDTPEPGTVLKCIVCAYEKPWSIFSNATGKAVCVDCKNALREWRG